MTDKRKTRTNELVACAIDALKQYRTSHDRKHYTAFRSVKRELYELWGKEKVIPILRFIVVTSGWAGNAK